MLAKKNYAEVSDTGIKDSYFDIARLGAVAVSDGKDKVLPATTRDGGTPPRRREEGLISQKCSAVQTNIDTFGSDEYDKRLTEFCLNYPQKYHRTIRNISGCSQRWHICRCPVENCEHEKRAIFRCRNRFCDNPDCQKSRAKRNYSRLMDWGFENCKFINFNIGISKRFLAEGQEFDALQKQVKKILDKHKRGNKIKGRIAWRFGWLSVFDVGRKTYNETGDTGDLWYHIHVTYVTKQRFPPFSRIMSDLRSCINEINPLIQLNYRPVEGTSSAITTLKKPTLWYLAQRDAGVFGHKRDGYYSYPDVMPLMEFLQQLHRRKALRYSLKPAGLIYNNSPSLAKPSCPIHLETLIFSHYERFADEVLTMQVRSSLSKAEIC